MDCVAHILTRQPTEYSEDYTSLLRRHLNPNMRSTRRTRDFPSLRTRLEVIGTTKNGLHEGKERDPLCAPRSFLRPFFLASSCFVGYNFPFHFVFRLLFRSSRLHSLSVNCNSPYACLRRTSKFHHQVTFTKYKSAKFYISFRKELQLKRIPMLKECKREEFCLQTRLGGEICSSDVITHKDHCFFSEAQRVICAEGYYNCKQRLN